MSTQTARPETPAAVGLWMQPSLRAEIEALGADMRTAPVTVIAQALQLYWDRYQGLARRPDADHPIPTDKPASGAEEVHIFMQPEHREKLERLAAGMKLGPSTLVQVAFAQWVETLAPHRQTALRNARERFRHQQSRELNEPSLDCRQQTLLGALEAIADIAAAHPPESFPVDSRVAARLDAVSEWLQALKRARAQAAAKPRGAARWQPNPDDLQDLSAMARESRRRA